MQEALEHPELASFNTYANSFDLDLESRNRAPATRFIYLDAVYRLGVFLADHGMPTAIDNIAREHVEAFIRELLRTRTPGTALNRYKSLQQFFNFLVREGELVTSPMAKMSQPSVVDDNPPAVLSVESLKALLKACDGADFLARRDKALILTMLDTGIRRAEAAGLSVADVDLRQRVIRVTGKGRRVRDCPLGAKAAQALDRYMRVRARHTLAYRPELWLGRDKALTGWGVADVVQRRAAEAGIGHVFPHQLRHSFAHLFRVAGGDDDSLMRLAGWQSREMLNRYGRSAADERAREVHRRLSPGDRL